jgi:hydroxyethylthiazole kinase-like uncharacterized protein yjeF
MTGRIVLTAAGMRDAEAAAIAGGTPVGTLMERAGIGAADAIWRYAGPAPALVLCGPGNNGGDGYVVARELAARGVPVRVAATGSPNSDAARTARASWGGPVEDVADTRPAPLLIDALFGTGLRRPLDPALSEQLNRLAAKARIRVAIDLPSGVATDDGAILSAVPDCDLIVTFQTLKPSHLLQPAARHIGRIVIVDIGIATESRLHEIGRPTIETPGADAHKFSRGLVTIVAGGMVGASALAAAAAMKAGAGAVRLQARTFVGGVPAAIIQTPGDPLARLDDARIGGLLLGPGLLADAEGRGLLDAALASGHPLVLDAGALRLVAERGAGALRDLAKMAILTPHAGEFRDLFGAGDGGSKVERARAAAAACGAVIVHKGADTVVAAPDGRAAILAVHSHWLASAGTGDVLAGTIAARRAAGIEAFEAACAGVWLHARAAALAGPALIADDLVAHLPAALVDCL